MTAVEGLIAHRGAALVGRQDLPTYPTPEATSTHKPIPHTTVVQALIETLGFRRLNVVSDQYAVTPDGARMFGVLALDVEGSGIRLAIGVRNSHDKSCSLGLTIGYKVFVCDNLAFHGDFSPVMRKHTSRVDIRDVMALAVDRMQRHFEPMQRQVDAWRGYELPDDRARLIIYRAFIEDGLDAAKHLARVVHQQYFEPEHEEFKARTLWSLSNAFTSAFKKLDPIPAFNATAKLGAFIEQFH
ncbi:MAG TPA: DUF932 domain-containing protein [Thermoanaerobaculia bacterium]|nr:DUF932 domain-containing protein [Thermoanaerobaculia bacterium]